MAVHVMADFETLDTKVSAIVIALGAVKFDLDAGTVDDAGFYASISVDSNLEYGRTMSEDTLMWWMRQSTEAQRVFFEPKLHLREAIEGFTEWLGDDEIIPWGNGPTFDLGKLAHIYEQLGWPVPWKYYNERCVRTYRALPGAKAIPKVQPVVAHHALADAHAQAQHVINIHHALFKGAAVAKHPMVKA